MARVAEINPGLLATNGVGAEVAGQLLVTAGENHDRITGEAAFAMLLRRRTDPRLLRQDHPAPTQPRR